jgi:hypothetical protein
LSIVKRGENKIFFGFPLGRFVKVPESLFFLAISDGGFSQQSYLSSIGLIEPHRRICYSNSTEFSRKRNARRSPIHRGPIFRYIDLFLKTRSKIKGSCVDISTRQQQRNLYRARIALHQYVSFSRRYIALDQNKKLDFSDRWVQRVNHQHKLHFYLFGGNRSRANSVYSQQYVGNLQLVRRLFSISWAPSRIPSWTKANEEQLVRRKISIDQITFEPQKPVSNTRFLLKHCFIL